MELDPLVRPDRFRGHEVRAVGRPDRPLPFAHGQAPLVPAVGVTDPDLFVVLSETFA